tara:strand:- start:68 stop:565 length:498 start_codon:yes stop_codon:yes gene_type:complete
MTVKPPSGMQEELARPVIEVVEFPSGKITHEMFAFGSEIAVVPVDGQSGNNSPIRSLAKDALVRVIRDWIGVESQVQFVSNSNANVYVPANMVATLVGKGGANIRQLQDEIGGISISVKTFDEMPSDLSKPNPYWEDVQDRRSRSSRAWENTGKSQRRKARKGRR